MSQANNSSEPGGQQIQGSAMPGAADSSERVRLRIDDTHAATSYTNAFRSTTSAEEVMIDFGLNSINLVQQSDVAAEVLFRSDHQFIMTYPTAKRLALTLGQIIRSYEEQFGPIEINPANRSPSAPPPPTSPG